MFISNNNKVRLKNQHLTEVPCCVMCNILLKRLLITNMVSLPRSKQLFRRPSAGYFHQNPIAWTPLFSSLVCQKCIAFSRIKCPKMNQPLVRRKFKVHISFKHTNKRVCWMVQIHFSSLFTLLLETSFPLKRTQHVVNDPLNRSNDTRLLRKLCNYQKNYIPALTSKSLVSSLSKTLRRSSPKVWA